MRNYHPRLKKLEAAAGKECHIILVDHIDQLEAENERFELLHPKIDPQTLVIFVIDSF